MGEHVRFEVVKATYSVTGEWIAELEADHREVERKLVRATKRYRPMVHGSINRVEVVAGAIIAGRLIEVVEVVGDLWGGKDDAKVQERANERLRTIEEKVLDLGLDLRAGCFEVRSS